MTERKMVSRIPKPAGDVGRSFGDSNKKKYSGSWPGPQRVRGKVRGQSWEPRKYRFHPSACGMWLLWMSSCFLPIAQLVNLVLAWPSS